MLEDRIEIEVGVQLVWCANSRHGVPGRKEIVTVTKVHKDNSFRVEGAGLEADGNRFTGYKPDYGQHAGKIYDGTFHAYGQTPGWCRVIRGGESQEQFDAEWAEVQVQKQAEKDERKRNADARMAAIREANAPLIEQTKAPLDFDGMYTVVLEDHKGNRMRVIYKPISKRVLLWEPKLREVDGVELHAAVYGERVSMNSGFQRYENEGENELDAILTLAARLW